MADAKKSPGVMRTSGEQALFDVSDAVFLLLHHQTGLFQTIRDVSVFELRARNNG